MDPLCACIVGIGMHLNQANQLDLAPAPMVAYVEMGHVSFGTNFTENRPQSNYIEYTHRFTVGDSDVAVSFGVLTGSRVTVTQFSAPPVVVPIGTGQMYVKITFRPEAKHESYKIKLSEIASRF